MNGRSKFEQMMDILLRCEVLPAEGMEPNLTNIIWSARLNYRTAKTLLTELVSLEALRYEGKRFLLTEKGEEALQAYHHIIHELQEPQSRVYIKVVNVS